MRWILPVVLSASALAGAQSVADLLPPCSVGSWTNTNSGFDADIFSTNASKRVSPRPAAVLQIMSANALRAIKMPSQNMSAHVCRSRRVQSRIYRVCRNHRPLSRISLTPSTDVQQFGLTFCEKYLAARPTSTGETRPSQTAPASTSPATNPANSPTTATAPSPTESVLDLSDWGANFPSTNWKSVKTKSKTDRGPAVEGVSITLFVIASLVVGFRWV